MTLRFEIPRKPVGTNAAYIRAQFGAKRGAGGGKGLIMSPEARNYKRTANACAVVAAQSAGWPDPATVKSVTLSITTYNTRHDADAAVKLTQDALEGVIYTKDSAVREVRALREKDGGAARVVVEITLI